MSGRVHVVGAGMAGLAAAVRLAEAGRAVTLSEAAPQAGGRARSYLDQALGCRIDNGNHLLIAGNRSALSYIDAVGARGTLTGPGMPVYPFIDRATGERWVLRFNLGRVPWWMASPARRVPGTTLGDYLKALKLRRSRPDDRVVDVLAPGTAIFRRLWQPLAVAALNTPLEQASAFLLAHVLAESIGAGGEACTPLVPRDGLSETLVDPALAQLRRSGAVVRFGARLRGIEFDDDRAVALDFEGGREILDDGDDVVLAVTAPVATRLVPDLTAPDQYCAILNAHYRFAAPENAPFFIGIIGGTAEWAFRKSGVVSVTVSAADWLLDAPEDELAATLWRDVAAAYELPSEPVPPVRIVRERRATFAATPAQVRRRPGAGTRWRNLALAGDWTDTGLPATIEGAIRSGFAAARLLGASGENAAQKALSGGNGRSKVAPLSHAFEPRPTLMSDAATTESRARAAPASALDHAVERAADALRGDQHADGHWCYELEADATIPAEYMLLQHYLGEIDDALQRDFAVYLRSTQGEHGGWPLFFGGDVDLSATVKAYFALKAAGDPPDAPHMARARAAVLARGGAAHSNVFTRIQLALFGELPWTAVPVMPVEIMLLPRWFPFHLSKVSYWSRTVIAPLLVLMALKPRAQNPRGVTVRELFAPGTQAAPPRASGSPWAWVFNRIDDLLRLAEPHMPKRRRQRAIDAAVSFVVERLNGDDGLGGIYPAIANSVMMFECLGYDKDDPALKIAQSALRKLVVRTPTRSYCQPCLSPVWDTALAAHALLEAGGRDNEAAARRSLDWLVPHQVLDLPGDWAVWRPQARPGGWAFQYANAYYPDLDDTAVVAMALDRADRLKWREPVARAAEWLLGMQCKTGGWAAFDADNEYYYLNYIPFADHGALLDPPTEDVSARCLSLMAQRGDKGEAFARGLDYLRRTQLPDGSWFGRWGTNYIYGTWSVLCALNVAGIDPNDPMIRRAVSWLAVKQRADGGWGEDGASYWRDRPRGEGKASAASQTAWALLALMAGGEIDNPAVARGVEYLMRTQQPHGLWDEAWYTAVGFPRVFYLRYHGYRAYFPLWALARYRALRRAGAKRTTYGM